MRLHLDPSAKFPRELEEHREKNKTAMDKILEWRATQENSAERRSPGDADRDDVDTPSVQD